MNYKDKNEEQEWRPLPSPKSKEADSTILALTGFDRRESITSKVCVFCATPVTLDSFKDELGLKEYHVSGICQDCQDKVF
jgi:hypothetical protein|tara:strand:+ start:44 stop:283 length:240 start_codon:yes stop_codon:yes gene_type:complete